VSLVFVIVSSGLVSFRESFVIFSPAVDSDIILIMFLSLL
jgi:hypothetical protein